MAKKLILKNTAPDKLKIGGNVINGLLNFNGPVDEGGNSAYIQMDSLPDVTGEKTITFSMFLDASSNRIESWISFRDIGSTDSLRLESTRANLGSI